MKQSYDIASLKYYYGNLPSFKPIRHDSDKFDGLFSYMLSCYSGTFHVFISGIDKQELNVKNKQLLDIIDMQCNFVTNLLVGGYKEIVIKNVFEEYYVDYMHGFNNLGYGLFDLTFAIRLYYIAFCEEAIWFKNKHDLKNIAKELLQSYGDKILYKIDCAIEKNPEILSLDGLDYVYENLNNYESSLLSENNGVKSMIYDKVCQEFIVFVLTMNVFDDAKLEKYLVDIIADNYFSFYEKYAHPKMEKKVKERLLLFISDFNTNNINSNANNLCDGCYERLQKIITKLYAKHSLDEVCSINNEFDEEAFIQTTEEDFNNILKNRMDVLGLNKKINNVAFRKSKNVGFVTINTPVRFLNKEDFSGQIKGYIDSLIVSTVFRTVGMDAFKVCGKNPKDEETLNFLARVDDSSMLFGSNPRAFLESYENFLKADKIINQNSNFVFGRNVAIAILNKNKTYINIDNVSVTVKKYDKQEVASQVSVSEGAYCVNVTNDIMLPYDELDAEKYIENNWRKVAISCDVTVECGNDTLGELIWFDKERNS